MGNRISLVAPFCFGGGARFKLSGNSIAITNWRNDCGNNGVVYCDNLLLFVNGCADCCA